MASTKRPRLGPPRKPTLKSNTSAIGTRPPDSVPPPKLVVNPRRLPPRMEYEPPRDGNSLTPPDPAELATHLTVRGRVERALFTCPRCAHLIVFVAYTRAGSATTAKRCPWCRLKVNVALHLTIDSRRRAPRSLLGERAVDTILPHRPGELIPPPPMTDTEPTGDVATDPLPAIDVRLLEPGEPYHRITRLGIGEGEGEDEGEGEGEGDSDDFTPEL